MNSGAIPSMSASSSGSLNGSSGSGGVEVALKKGPWMAAEDKVLVEYVERYGEGNWNVVRKKTGLLRCGKSCRLRWTNHLRPNLKKGSFTHEEERLIIELHSRLGNKWARMAAQLPGRTDNEIKNFWNTRIKRRLRDGLPLYPRSQKPRQASPSQPPPQHSSVVNNELFIPQHQTAIPLFHGPFQSGFHGTEHVFYQTSTLLQDTSPLPIPSPRHKRCCDSSAFSISIMSTSSNDHPSVLSPHGIIPDTPLSFDLSSMQMEMGATPSPNSFSMVNLELPSSQSQFPRITNTAESCSGGSLFFDPGVFGDVTEEAHAWANIPLNNFPNAYTQSEMNQPASNLVSPSGITLDTSPATGINPSQEDQAKLSDFFPPNILTPTSEVNSWSPNISALGCAAAAQDGNDVRDNLGLDLHDIAALFPGASMVELGILPWENLTETY